MRKEATEFVLQATIKLLQRFLADDATPEAAEAISASQQVCAVFHLLFAVAATAAASNNDVDDEDDDDNYNEKNNDNNDD
jgi:hypothetical protein